MLSKHTEDAGVQCRYGGLLHQTKVAFMSTEAALVQLLPTGLKSPLHDHLRKQHPGHGPPVKSLSLNKK